MKYFISGHRDLSYKDFEKYYIPKIKDIVQKDNEAKFIVGDCNGVDKYAMDYIFCETMSSVVIYHMFVKPRNTPKDKHPGDLVSDYKGVSFKGGFKSDEERDSAMTNDSDFDIAFVKDNRWNSGTAQNIKRRHRIK